VWGRSRGPTLTCVLDPLYFVGTFIRAM
jgi:hypothetical protein